MVGFEAMISSQIITVQIKDKTKIEDCYFHCCTATNGNLKSGNGGILCFAFNTALKCWHVLTSSRTSFALLPFKIARGIQKLCEDYLSILAAAISLLRVLV